MKLLTLLKKSFYIHEDEYIDEEKNVFNTIEIYESEEYCEPIGILYDLKDGKFRWGNIYGKILHNTILSEKDFKNIIKNKELY